MSQRLNNIYDFGYDPKFNTIYLIGKIHKKRAANLIKLLWSIVASSEAEKEFKPITLAINSLGGDVYDTFAIYDIMNVIPNPIHTICFGTCQSSAVLLAAAGKKRLAMPDCSFMMHDLQVSGPEMSLESSKKELEFNIFLNNRFNTLLSQHSRLSIPEIEKMCQNSGDTYFDSQKAVEYGIIDGIFKFIPKDKK